MECKRLPTDYEIRDFTLKIILLNPKFWFNSFLKTPKRPARWAGWIKSDFISNIQFNQYIPHFH